MNFYVFKKKPDERNVAKFGKKKRTSLRYCVPTLTKIVILDTYLGTTLTFT